MVTQIHISMKYFNNIFLSLSLVIQRDLFSRMKTKGMNKEEAKINKWEVEEEVEEEVNKMIDLNILFIKIQTKKLRIS